VDGNELLTRVSRLAACALLAVHWPKGPGSRHHIANAAAGFLLRNGLPEEVTVDLIEGAAFAARDEEWQDRGKSARATAENWRQGNPITGAPTLAELLGGGEVAAALGGSASI